MPVTLAKSVPVLFFKAGVVITPGSAPKDPAATESSSVTPPIIPEAVEVNDPAATESASATLPVRSEGGVGATAGVSARCAPHDLLLVYPKAGAVASLFQIVTDPRLNHRVEVTRGVREAECANELQSFFAALRRGPTYQ